MGEKVRVEVTFNTDKHADILEAMKKFGSQAGFLKFAAAHYLNTTAISSNTAAQPGLLQRVESEKEPEQSQNQTGKRRLPPGFGNQAFSIRLEEES